LSAHPLAEGAGSRLPYPIKEIPVTIVWIIIVIILVLLAIGLVRRVL
jgi:hypothetical protein